MSTLSSTSIVKAEEYISSFLTARGVEQKERYQLTQDDVFNFEFVDDYTTIYTNTNKYLTVIARDNVIWSQIDTVQEKNKFNYILNKDTIILFKYNTDYQQVLVMKPNSEYYGFQTINPSSSNPFPLESIIHIDSLHEKEIEYTDIKDSFIASYKTDSIETANSIEVTTASRNREYKQSYIVNIPLDSTDPTYKVYINSLKNYYTSNYTNCFTPTIDSLSTVHRHYTGLFTGGSQHKGYEHIYLNYKANTSTFVLPKNEEKYFNAPPSLPTSGVYISATTLFTDGAIAGKNPFTSDRIAINARDYRDVSLPVISGEFADNTWQFTWLSAGEAGQAVWMDRYYTSGLNLDIDTDKRMLFTSKDIASNIVDTPSTLRILPNRLYKYYHQGQASYKKYTDMFKYIHTDSSTEILNITSWGSTTLTDTSVNRNSGEIVGDVTNLYEDKLHLNGATYAVFSSSGSMQEGRELYLGMWVEAEDWKNIQGSQIIGNFAEGGVGLFNKQTNPTNVITLYDRNNNYIYNINSELTLINETYNNLVASATDTVFVYRFSDLTYIILNSTKGYVIKYDINNNIINQIDISDYITDVTQIETDSAENLYLYSRANSKVICIGQGDTIVFYDDRKDPVSMALTTISSSSTPEATAILQGLESGVTVESTLYDRIEVVSNLPTEYTQDIIQQGVDGSSFVIGVYGDNSVVDVYGNIWHVKGINLYKNKSYFASVGRIISITADNQGNVWLLYNKTKLVKIDAKLNKIMIDKVLFSEIERPLESRSSINFITRNIGTVETDFLVAVDDIEKSIYLVDTQGEIYNKIYLENMYTSFFAKNNYNTADVEFIGVGDYTGYSYQRKFKLSRDIEWKLSVVGSEKFSSTKNQMLITLPLKTDNLQQGKHYFSFNFSSSKGYVKAYIDGVLVKEHTLKDTYFYRIYNSGRPLTLGASTSRQGVLKDTINLSTDNKFKGYVYKLHMYKYSFEDSDVEALYISDSEKDNFKDLKWNLNIGTRNFIEKIDRYFTFSMPGSKSKYFNIRVRGFDATEEHKQIINTSLEELMPRFAPADTHLNKIIWD